MEWMECILTIHHHHPPTWPLVTKPGSVVVGCCWFDQYPMIHFSCHFHSFHSYNQEFSRWSGGPPRRPDLGETSLALVDAQEESVEAWGLRMLRDIWYKWEYLLLGKIRNEMEWIKWIVYCVDTNNFVMFCPKMIGAEVSTRWNTALRLLLRRTDEGFKGRSFGGNRGCIIYHLSSNFCWPYQPIES